MTEKYPFIGLPSIDEEVSRPLKDLLGDNYTDLINDYFSSFPDKLQDLKVAAQSDDVNSILQISHTLKSSTGSFGFIRLFKQLEYIEHQAREENLVDHINQVELIEKEFQSILSQTDSYTSSL